MEQLFLFEFMVERIFLRPVIRAPQKKNLKVVVNVGKTIKLEIRSEEDDEEKNEKGDGQGDGKNKKGKQKEKAADKGKKKGKKGKKGKKEDLEEGGKRVNMFNLGKSYLFPCRPEDLLNTCAKYPLEILLDHAVKETNIGFVKRPWPPDFIFFLQSLQTSFGKPAPASQTDSLELKDNEAKIIGRIDTFMRMSCFGNSIHTQYQVISPRKETSTSSTQYLFKNSKVPMSTPIYCEKFGNGVSTEVIPVAPIYTSADIYEDKNVDKKESKEEMTAERINQMLCNNKDCPGVQGFYEYGIGPLVKFKPDKLGPTNIPLTYGLRHTCASIDMYGPSGAYSRPKSLDQPFIPKDNVECYPRGCFTNPDCNKLGSCNNPCYCNLKKDTCYQPERPPRSEVRATTTCCCTPPAKSKLAGGSILRLRGGGPTSEDDSDSKIPKPMNAFKDLMDDYDKLLIAYKKAVGPCGQSTCPFAQNILDAKCKKCCGGTKIEPLPENIKLCPTPDCPKSKRLETRPPNKGACGSPVCPFTKKSIPHDDDEDFTEFKLGAPLKQPVQIATVCGKPKCPFPIPPPTPLEPIHWDCPDPLPKGLCTNPDCPYLPRIDKYFRPPAGPCGGLACPHAQSQTCGMPSCPPGAATKPKSSCQPSGCPPPSCPPSPCPPQPCYPPPPSCCQPSGCPPPSCPPSPCPPQPCYSPPCYSPCYPPPCYPPCYSPPPCPFLEPPTCPPPCPLPPCPFEKKGKPCPFSPPASTTCDADLADSICDNPECPFAANRDDICSNPDCPFAIKDDSESICDNPDCPFATKNDSESICDNPACPFAKKASPPCPPPPCPPPPCGQPCMPLPCMPINICNIPNCPYSTPLPPCYSPPCSPPPCPVSPCPQPPCPPAGDSCTSPEEDVCDNPDCPFVTKKSSPCYVPQPESETCSNPTCPFAKKPSPCAMPKPCHPPPCSPSPCLPPPCGIPNCPFDVGSPPPPPPAPNPSECAISAPEGDHTTKMTFEYAAGGDFEDETKSAIGEGTKSKRASQSEPTLSKRRTSKNGLKETSQSEKAIPESDEKNKKRRKSTIYDRYYPGVKVGHRECLMPGFPVPANMGWSWNVYTPCIGLKPRRGWRPGAVTFPIAKRIWAHRKERESRLLALKASHSRVKSSKSKESNMTVAPKPTLQIKKEKGFYYITVNPLKDPKTHLDADPYLDCTPMQFKVSKNKNKENADPNKLCQCDNDAESTDSGTLDFEFTPPAGIPLPPRKRRKKVFQNTLCQYDPADFTPPKEKKGKGKGKGKGKKGKGKGKKKK